MRVIALLAVLGLLFGGFVAAMPYFNCILMRDHDIVEQPFDAENLTQRMTSEAVDFIERFAQSPGPAEVSNT